MNESEAPRHVAGDAQRRQPGHVPGGRSPARLDRPAQEAIDLLEKAVDRSKRRSGVRLPLGFARNSKDEKPVPPLAKLLRGGGEVRIKVFLTVLMMATKYPHSTTVASKDMAAMLNLNDPEVAGARRVSKAFKDLSTEGLVRRQTDPGHVPVTTVRHPDGSGKIWDIDKENAKTYITLPPELWRRGWLIALSGRAIAVLIILREATGGRPGSRAWVPGIRRKQYGISADTWTRGSSELCEAGLLDVELKTYADHGEPRQRNVYTLHLDRLGHFDPGELEPEG